MGGGAGVRIGRKKIAWFYSLRTLQSILKIYWFTLTEVMYVYEIFLLLVMFLQLLYWSHYTQDNMGGPQVKENRGNSFDSV